MAYPETCDALTHLLNPYPTMSNRLLRLLLFWLVVALQAMTPFIHAHAGSVQLKHAESVHVHHPIGMGCHAASTDHHGATVAVAQGVPLRHATLSAAEDARVFAVPGTQPVVAGMSAADVHVPVFLTWHPPSPDHTLPQVLAPPFC